MGANGHATNEQILNWPRSSGNSYHMQRVLSMYMIIKSTQQIVQFKTNESVWNTNYLIDIDILTYL